MTDKALTQVSSNEPGLRRHRHGEGFRYLDAEGRPVSAADRERIDALAIPPAWTHVWICPDPSGHLQATGVDDKGRKQYIYHDEWRDSQDSAKFTRLEAFGQALPGLREALQADLSRPGLGRDKVVAAIVRIMERTFVRIGSKRYADDNGSYGVATIKDDHVDVTSRSLRLSFPGKGGKEHEVTLDDPRVAAVVKACQELPGERLFEYRDAEGAVREVGSADINRYLRETMDGPFSAKDFRTWAATTLMLDRLLDRDPPDDEKEGMAVVREALDEVADELEHTPAVCKKSYIHPVVPAAYLDGSLWERVKEAPAVPGLWPEERKTLALMASYAR
ncbi:MAG: DNA topoisomerase IB [Euryarchaeota archaeon]|nr:DNA topoisomerase IB [Euryarchaeota archaeon]